MIYNVLAQIKEWFIWLFAQISALPVLWQEDRELFFFLVAGFCAVILIIVLTIILIKKHKNKKATPEDVYLSDYNIVNKPKMTKFIPVEYLEPDVDSNDLMLSLEDRIIACQDGITSDARERIVKNSPQSLSVLVNVYTKCSPATQQDMLKIVRELHMMEEYSKCLLQEGYHQGVLISAWQFFPDVNVLRSFVGLLASRQEEMQHAAVRLLSTLQEPKVLPILVLALIQPNIYVPARVAEVFISMPEQSANLLSYMLPEVEDKHKHALLEIIVQTGVSFDARNVIACLQHDDFRIRSTAALALGSGGIRSAVPELLLATNDKYWQVRASVAKSLGILGDRQAIAVLEGLLHDKEGWVAASAKESLEMLK